MDKVVRQYHLNIEKLKRKIQSVHKVMYNKLYRGTFTFWELFDWKEALIADMDEECGKLHYYNMNKVKLDEC